MGMFPNCEISTLTGGVYPDHAIVYYINVDFKCHIVIMINKVYYSVENTFLTYV